MKSQGTFLKGTLLACAFLFALGSFAVAAGNTPPPPPPPPPKPGAWQIEIVSMDLHSQDGLTISNIGSGGSAGTTPPPPPPPSGGFPTEILSMDFHGARSCNDCLVVSNIGSSGNALDPEDEIIVILRPAPGLQISNIGSSGLDGVSAGGSEPLSSEFLIAADLRPMPQASTSGDHLTVSNIGSSGEDGVVENGSGTWRDGDIRMTATADENGEFWFEDLRPGTYELRVYPPDPIHGAWQMTVGVGEGTIFGSMPRIQPEMSEPSSAGTEQSAREAADEALGATEQAAREAADDAAREAARDAADDASRGASRR